MEKKGFLRVHKHRFFSKLPLTCGGNVDYYKSVYHPISTLAVGVGNRQAIFKTISKLSFQLSVQVCPLLGQNDGGRKDFLKDARRAVTL